MGLHLLDDLTNYNAGISGWRFYKGDSDECDKKNNIERYFPVVHERETLNIMSLPLAVFTSFAGYIAHQHMVH